MPLCPLASVGTSNQHLVDDPLAKSCCAQITYLTLSTAQLSDTTKTTIGLTITGFVRLGNLTMSFRGTDGMVVHLDHHVALLQTRDGNVSYVCR